MTTSTHRPFRTLFPALHFLLATALSLIVALNTREHPQPLDIFLVAIAVGGALFGAGAFYNWWRGRGTGGLFLAGLCFHLGTPLLTGWLGGALGNGGAGLGIVLLIQALIVAGLVRHAAPVRPLATVWHAMANVLGGLWLMALVGAVFVAL